MPHPKDSRRANKVAKVRRRTWEEKMVINKITILPTRMKIKVLLLVVATWLLWLFTLYILISESDYLLNSEIKFGWSLLELLQIMVVIFLAQMLISCVWAWLILPRKKK